MLAGRNQLGLPSMILFVSILMAPYFAAFAVSTDRPGYFATPVLKKDFTCGSDFCKNIACPLVTDCPEESVRRNGSLCGCCDICVKHLNENESCIDENKVPPPKVLHKICKKGLHCKDGICVKQTSTPSCEVEAKWRKCLRDDKSNLFSDELWIPECDEHGNYRNKQCKRKKCLCYDEDGKALFGQEERELAKDMACGCSRTMAKLQQTLQPHWMTEPQEHCDKRGDYNELQCIGDICYCSNATTGEVIGRVTKMEFRELLPCYEDSLPKAYKTQCEHQLMRTRSLRYQFHRKNIDIIGLEYVDCDVDGNFASKQCTTDKCVCVDRKGTGIKSYSIDRGQTLLEMAMKCNCARDEHDVSTTHAHYRRMVCDAGGNFVPLQCFQGNYCFCVDEDGDIISRRFSYAEADNEVCLTLRSILQNSSAGSCS